MEQWNNIHTTFYALDRSQQLEYLEKTWQALEGETLDYRIQHALYGKDSVQGRELDQCITSTVYLIQQVEQLMRLHFNVGA